MRSELAFHVARPGRARVAPIYQPLPTRPLTPRELELAADLELARGNRQRAELLSWQAHDARAAVSA